MVGEMPTRGRLRMTILKVGGGHSAQGVIVASEIASLRLHWIGKRSYVCPGEECEACQTVSSRWAGFVPMLVDVGPGRPKGVTLLEVTESAWLRFDGLCRMEQDRELFGMRVSVLRRRAKEALLIDPLGRGDLGTRRPIRKELVYDVLATIYQLPSLRDGESVEEWSDRASVAARHQLQVGLLRETR